MIIGNASLLKEINTSAILNIVREHEPISRTDIAKTSKLALPTVMRLVERLISMHILREIGKGDSSGGRKPMLLMLNESVMYAVGANISENIEVAVIDLKGVPLISWSEPIGLHGATPEDAINRVIYLVNLAIEESGINLNKIAGVGIGVPGTNFDTTPLIEDSIFNGWNRIIDVSEMLSGKVNLEVTVDNIGRTKTYGELWYGYGRHYSSFAYMMLDFGVGGGIVIDGEMLKGQNGSVGEFGHTTLDPVNGPPCYCGNRGCLERYVSKPALFHEIRRRMIGGEPSVMTVLCGGDYAKIDLSMMKAAADMGDALCISVQENAGEYLGYAIANIINITNTLAVVLGGNVAIKCDVMVRRAREVAHRNIFSNKARETKILISALEDGYSCIGAAKEVIEQIFNNMDLTI